MAYAWMVTRDHLDKRDVRVIGPHVNDPALVAKLKAGEGARFRMLDDDGEVYYSGQFIGDTNSEDAFGPLDGYGMPNAGCTTIEYRSATGTWEPL